MVYNGKPYFLMDDLGVPLFLETPILTFWNPQSHGGLGKLIFRISISVDFSVNPPFIFQGAFLVLKTFCPPNLKK